ncbi:MAG: hypothetical protein R3B82_27530 [Sandaracinaceae bacterium]
MDEITKLKNKIAELEGQLREQGKAHASELQAVRFDAAFGPAFVKAGGAPSALRFASKIIREQDQTFEVGADGKVGLVEFGGHIYRGADELAAGLLAKMPNFSQAHADAVAAGRGEGGGSSGLPANWRDLSPTEMATLGLSQLPRDVRPGDPLPEGWKDMSAGEMADLAFGNQEKGGPKDKSPQGMIARGLEKGGHV